MTWWEAALWALLGSALVEANDLYREIRRRRDVPWNRCGRDRHDRPVATPGVYALGAGLRLFLGFGVAAAAGASGFVEAPWSAVTIGLASMLIVERVAAAAQDIGQPAGQALVPPKVEPPGVGGAS